MGFDTENTRTDESIILIPAAICGVDPDGAGHGPSPEEHVITAPAMWMHSGNN